MLVHYPNNNPLFINKLPIAGCKFPSVEGRVLEVRRTIKPGLVEVSAAWKMRVFEVGIAGETGLPEIDPFVKFGVFEVSGPLEGDFLKRRRLIEFCVLEIGVVSEFGTAEIGRIPELGVLEESPILEIVVRKQCPLAERRVFERGIVLKLAIVERNRFREVRIVNRIGHIHQPTFLLLGPVRQHFTAKRTLLEGKRHLNNAQKFFRIPFPATFPNFPPVG